MKQIALKNFRKFQEFPGSNIESGMLDLKDITILVGRNNAGKSTLVKAIILLMENLQRPGLPLSTDAYFNFHSDKYNLHVDTFARALNNQTEDKQISFCAQIQDFNVTVDVSEADDFQLYNHLQEEEDATAPIHHVKVEDCKRGVVIDMYPYLQYIKMKIKADNTANEEKSEIDEQLRLLRNELSIYKDALETQFNPVTRLSLTITENADYSSKVESLERRIKQLSSSPQRKAVSTDIEFELKSYWLQYSDNWEPEYPIVKDLLAIVNFEGMRFLSRKDQDNDAEKAYIFIRDNRARLTTMVEDFKRALSLVSVDYLQAHLASQEIMLSPKMDGSIMARIIEQYMSYTAKFSKNAKSFILDWMSQDKFGIGSDFEIKQYPGHNYVVKVSDFNGKLVNIADLGMGANQVLILLFHVANNIALQKKTLLFVEEPEQNLHPQVQSLLADFMVDVNEKYGIKFFVETHSEYLIKRTQVIVGDAEYKDEADLKAGNPFVVYYFDEERGVYDMKYQRSGAFAEKFGDGFVDVAPMAHMKTMMRQRKDMQNA